jgi:hypothetical protein
MRRPYDLAPSFFAGEPIEDICPLPGPCDAPHTNRLVIRMQHTANRPVEVNDTLYFDIQNALKVAQCVRGSTKGGKANFDTRLVTAPDGTLIPGLPWCDWTSGGTPADAGTAMPADGGAAMPADGGVAMPADGGIPPMTAPMARINLSTQDYVRASLVPLFTCTETLVTGVALPGSWIDFQDFGEAAQPQIPADMREKPDNDFKVEFGQRLRARFHLVLEDQHVVDSIRTRMAIPDSKISGVLDGWFDFDLERGRAAQPFP